MGKVNTLGLKGKSGESYVFDIHPMDQEFNAVAAVYVIMCRYKDSKGAHIHKVIYIGETEDLSERFENYHKADCLTRHKATFICTHPGDDADSRLAKEDDLIKRHNPICND